MWGEVNVDGRIDRCSRAFLRGVFVDSQSVRCRRRLVPNSSYLTVPPCWEEWEPISIAISWVVG